MELAIEAARKIGEKYRSLEWDRFRARRNINGCFAQLLRLGFTADF